MPIKEVLKMTLKTHDYTQEEIDGNFVRCPKCGRIGLLSILTVPEGEGDIIHEEKDALYVNEIDEKYVDVGIYDLVTNYCNFSKEESIQYGFYEED